MEAIQNIILQSIEDFFAYAPLQRSFLALLPAVTACAFLSVWVSIKRMAFLAPAMGGISLGGYAFGLWLFPAAMLGDWRLFAASAGLCLLASFVISFISRAPGVKEDGAIGAAAVGILAAAMLIFSSGERDILHLKPYLFGSPLLVTDADLILLLCAAIGTMAFGWLFYRDAFAMDYDPHYANAVGLPVAFIHHAGTAVTAIVAVVCIKAIGMLLTTAFLILPGLFARLTARRFHTMISLALVFAIFTVLIGFGLSLCVDTLPLPAVIVGLQAGITCTAAILHRMVVWGVD
ncbi:hypothetical protein GF373_10770 [bacterium]|nr:hypothetical protein [bacterium]